MKAAYDLHIHSCLSPGADDDMTPANIAGMAHLKGLCIISLTDHNCGSNLIAMAQACKDYDQIFIPGIEVTSVEEVHLLVYFDNIDAAINFSDIIYNSLPNINNRPEIFGNQIVMSTEDKKVGTLDKLLLQATPYTIEEIVSMASAAGGHVVPAHINRASNSLLNNIGFIPQNLFNWVEIRKDMPCPNINENINVLLSSDAHRLGDILEPIHIIDHIEDPRSFLRLLKVQSIGIVAD